MFIVYWRSHRFIGVPLGFWLSNQVSGVQPGFLAFKPGFWRSTRYSGVQPDILAFNPIFWRSTRYSGVQPDILAFNPIFWRSTCFSDVQPDYLSPNNSNAMQARHTQIRQSVTSKPVHFFDLRFAFRPAALMIASSFGAMKNPTARAAMSTRKGAMNI
nr:hypothetical protein [Sporosarcina sp. NCCP-2222]